MSGAGIWISLTPLLIFLAGKPGLLATTKFASFKASSMSFQLSSSASESEPAMKKSSAPLPREDIPALLDRIYRWELEPPVALGQKLVENIAGSGVDLIATRSVPGEV